MCLLLCIVFCLCCFILYLGFVLQLLYKAICWFCTELFIWYSMLSPKSENRLLTHLTLPVADLCYSFFMSSTKLHFLLETWRLLILQPLISGMGHKHYVRSGTLYYNELTRQLRMSTGLSCLHIDIFVPPFNGSD